MARVTFEDGTIINFEGTPTQEDIEDAYNQVKGVSTQTTIQEKPKDFLPGAEKVKELRKSRPPITTEPFERFASIKSVINSKEALTNILRSAGEIGRTVESGLASAGLEAQRGAKPRDIISAFYGGDVTEKPAEFGDIPRSAGVPEPLSALIGLGTAMAIPDIASLGNIRYGKNLLADAKQIAKTGKATGKFIAKPFKPFKSLKSLFGPGQRELGEKISGLTEDIKLAKETTKESISGIEKTLEQEKAILSGRLKLANDIYKDNKKVIMETLQQDAEAGTLTTRERLPELYRANSDTYKAGLDEISKKAGDISLENARGILLDTIEESEQSYLRGSVLQRIKRLLNTKYKLPKQTAEEGVEEFLELPQQKGKTLAGWVKKAGGIDPEKTRKAGYNISEDFKQFGLNNTLKKGGQSIDDIAKSAQEEGIIPTLPNENPSDTLMRLLKEKYSFGELETGQLGKTGDKFKKTFSFQDLKADIDEIADSIEYGKRSTSEAIPAYILRKKLGAYISDTLNIDEFKTLQQNQSEAIELMKWADKYFRPFSDPLASKQGVELLKRFGLGKSKLGEEKFLEKLEKGTTSRGGIGDITSSLKARGKELQDIEDKISKTRTDIEFSLQQKDILSKANIEKIRTELTKRLDDLEYLKKIETIKLQNRRQAERLLWYMGIGLAGATQLGRAGRFIKGIGAFGMAQD